jgi:hypothetical protein
VKDIDQVSKLLELMRNISVPLKPLPAAETGYWRQGVYWPTDSASLPKAASESTWPLTIYLEAEPHARGSVAADVVVNTKFHEMIQSPYEVEFEVC